MPETTYEEAKRCPKCHIPGEVTSSTKSMRPDDGINLPQEITVEVIYCRTKLCPWENTCWVVQVNADGTIPQPGSQLGPKQYPKLSAEMESKVMNAIDAQIWDETHPPDQHHMNPYR